MLRPFHFIFLFVALAILAFSAVADEGNLLPNVQSEIEPQPDANGNNDLEADATYWGYRRPWRYGGWGGYGGYGRHYWRGGWGGRGYYGRGWGGWGGYYG